jgi:hypothetical protein
MFDHVFSRIVTSVWDMFNIKHGYFDHDEALSQHMDFDMRTYGVFE